jgi:hypothetical protein
MLNCEKSILGALAARPLVDLPVAVGKHLMLMEIKAFIA